MALRSLPRSLFTDSGQRTAFYKRRRESLRYSRLGMFDPDATIPIGVSPSPADAVQVTEPATLVATFELNGTGVPAGPLWLGDNSPFQAIAFGPTDGSWNFGVNGGFAAGTTAAARTYLQRSVFTVVTAYDPAAGRASLWADGALAVDVTGAAYPAWADSLFSWQYGTAETEALEDLEVYFGRTPASFV